MELKKYNKLLWYMVWKMSKKYRLDIEELYSQAIYIFCLILNSFDSDKACFSTYLYSNLYARLNLFCKQELRVEKSKKEAVKAYYNNSDNSFNLIELKTSAEQTLSIEALKVFYWVLENPRYLDNRGTFRLQTKNTLKKLFKKTDIVSIWCEITSFWKQYAFV